MNPIPIPACMCDAEIRPIRRQALLSLESNGCQVSMAHKYLPKVIDAVTWDTNQLRFYDSGLEHILRCLALDQSFSCSWWVCFPSAAAYDAILR